MDNGGAVLDGGVAGWEPIGRLRARFDENVGSLRTRMPAVAQALASLQPPSEYVFRIDTPDALIRLGRRGDDGTCETLEPSLPPAEAEKFVAQIAQNGAYSIPVLIVGLDQGWLEERLYRVPPTHPALPGFKAPIYLLCSSIERLWLVLHLHDWRQMLADPRFMLFVGRSASTQLQDTLQRNPKLPLPRVAVNVEQGLLPPGTNLDGLIRPVQDDINERFRQLRETVQASYAGVDRAELLKRFESGRLKILGITSRFTTFLQYSMRDWQAGMRQLGHETRLLIEDVDHEILNSLSYAQACAEFQPDLIVIIDHYRREFTGLPEQIPCVMWIQDQLPNIYCDKAGQDQGRLDYTIGYGKTDCVLKHGYPADRFMPAMVGVNEKRFAPRRLTPSEIERFACDVSFVSHCTAPADVVVQQAVEQQTDARTKRLLKDVYDRLVSRHAAGEPLVTPRHVKDVIAEVAGSGGTGGVQVDAMAEFFHLRVVNPLFRHMALSWLLDLGLDVRLYGRGWEQHPQYQRYARGVADNQADLCTIYQASRINLQITPYSSAHQRLFEGLSAGGFFLLRHTMGDTATRLMKEVWDWCEPNGVASEAELTARAPQELRDKFVLAVTTAGANVHQGDRFDWIRHARTLAEDGFSHCASTLWGEDFDRVAFRSKQELHERIAHYLGKADERRDVASRMRQRVLERMSYTTTTRRMLDFITADFRRP
jgi:hypothetical protein